MRLASAKWGKTSSHLPGQETAVFLSLWVCITYSWIPERCAEHILCLMAQLGRAGLGWAAHTGKEHYGRNCAGLAWTLVAVSGWRERLGISCVCGSQPAPRDGMLRILGRAEVNSAPELFRTRCEAALTNCLARAFRDVERGHLSLMLPERRLRCLH